RPLMLETKARRFPSGENDGEPAAPTRVIAATAAARESSAARAGPAAKRTRRARMRFMAPTVLLGEGLLDGLDELRRLGLCSRAEGVSHRAVAPDEVLVEIPARLVPSLGEETIDRRLVRARLHLDLGEHGELHAVAGLAEGLDLFRASRLLAPQLV